MRRVLAAFLLTTGLMACDAGPSALPARDHAAPPPIPAEVPVVPPIPVPPGSSPLAEAKAAPAKTAAGVPIWSSNSRMSAEENARAHFEKDGAAFGARTVEEFVAMAHAFTAKPPKGAQELRRPNGDRLIYDARTNVFAVARRDGAPRTMFKPDDGAAYWAEQKRIEARRG